MAATLLLFGCRAEDARAPFTESRIPPGLAARFHPPQGWAWGLVKTGKAPAARYGVSSPPSHVRADVLILTSYGEPAEAWFETARDLNAEGYVVWVLEPVGQGGSGRWVLPRDLGYAPSLRPDADAAQALAALVVRRRPLYVLASRTSAPAALIAFDEGLAADGLILSAPELEPAQGARAPQLLVQLGLSRQRAPGGGAWKRDGPNDVALDLTRDPERGRVRLAWQTANPDLRMGGPSWGWRAAFAEAANKAAALPAPRLKAKVLLLETASGSPAARALCMRLGPRCQLQTFAGSGPALQAETDSVRRPWLGAVESFIEADIARFSPPPPKAGSAVDPDPGQAP